MIGNNNNNSNNNNSNSNSNSNNNNNNKKNNNSNSSSNNNSNNNNNKKKKLHNARASLELQALRQGHQRWTRTHSLETSNHSHSTCSCCSCCSCCCRPHINSPRQLAESQHQWPQRSGSAKSADEPKDAVQSTTNSSS